MAKLTDCCLDKTSLAKKTLKSLCCIDVRNFGVDRTIADCLICASTISQPIFEGGTLSARRRAAQAALDVAAAQYSSTVNTAFQNVANALVAIERDAETLQAALAAQKTSAASLAVARSQYQAGAGTYLNVLTAEQADFSARLNLITARAARFTDTVGLFQALGGGWWNRNDVDQKVAQCCGVIP